MQQLLQTCRQIKTVPGNTTSEMVLSNLTQEAQSQCHDHQIIMWRMLSMCLCCSGFLDSLTTHCMSASSALTEALAQAHASGQSSLPDAEGLQAVGEPAAQHAAVQAASCWEPAGLHAS